MRDGQTHFDECGGAADERRVAAGLVRVLGEGRHEGQIDVDVRIDEAGEDQLPAASMTSVPGGASRSAPMRVMVSSST